MTSITSIACKGCHPSPTEYQAKSLWDVLYNIASCTNCGYERPYVTRKAFTSGKKTQAQEKALEWLKREIMKHDSHNNPERCEFKKWEVTLTDYGKVYLVSEVGGKDDEGTMAAVFARSYRLIWIGPRGGLKLVNAAKYVDDGKAALKKVSAPDVTGGEVTWCITF